MLNKLKHKFIFIMMTYITIILMVVFGMLGYNTYHRIYTDVENSLTFALQQQDTPMLEFKDFKKQGSENPQSTLNTFVVITDDSYTVSQTHSNNYTISTTEAQKLIDSLDKNSTSIKRTGHFAYIIKQTKEGYQIAFANTTNSRNMWKSFLLSSAGVGVSAWVAFLILSVLLSSWALKPVEKSWQQQKQFLQDASHELKTPLTIILANTDLILNHEGSSKNKKLVQTIQSESLRMKKLVEDLLFLARNDTAQTKPEKTKCNLSEIAWKCILSCETVAFENNLELESDIEDDVYVDANPDQLNQLLLIFLDNAIKYTPEHKKIHFALSKTTMAQVTIFNEGSYIPQEEKTNIFERFYRLDKSREYKGGHGLGLSIATQIAKAYDIDMQVESSKEKGTKFILSIPVSKS